MGSVLEEGMLVWGIINMVKVCYVGSLKKKVVLELDYIFLILFIELNRFVK